MDTQLTLGFSPCPNDTFIFDAMIHGKIDTEGLVFDYTIADVETLNKQAFKNKINISKLSYYAFSFVSKNYQLLKSGSALGYKCGPLLISKKNLSYAEIENSLIAIPGKYTTANFLFSLAFPNALQKKEILFSEIENAILDGSVDAGVIIHENRFTYESKGLIKIIDLGEQWEKQYKMPIPLGGISIQRSLPHPIKQKVNRIIRRSLEHAITDPHSSYKFIKSHAQELNDDVIFKHIDLYVNKFSLNIGIIGKNAVDLMFMKGIEKGIIENICDNIFV